MAKNTIRDLSTTAADNTDLGGIGIQGSSNARNIDDAMRYTAKMLADWNTGAEAVDDTATFGDPANSTKRVRLDAGNVEIGQTRVLTMPNADVDISAFAATVLDDADAAGMRDTLGVTALIDGKLDARDTLKPDLFVVSNADDLTTNGWGRVISTGPTNPVAGQGFEIETRSTNSTQKFQTATRLAPTATDADTGNWRRHMNGSVWGSWYRINLSQTEITNLITAQVPSGTTALAEAGTDTTLRKWSAEQLRQSAEAHGAGGGWDVILQDQRASGTNAGASVSGSWQQRVLNTEVYDPSNLATLTSNQFTFTEDGEVEFWAMAVSSARAQSRLWNVTDSVEVAVGATISNTTNSGGTSQGWARVVAGKQYELQYRVSSSVGTFGQGVAAGWGTELYAEVKYRKG